MKRIVALVLVLATAFSLSACCFNVDKTGMGSIFQPDQSDVQSDTSNVKHTGKKIIGPITSTTLFSEGLALVMTKNDSDTIYCINTDGYIVFELDRTETSFMPLWNKRFCGGFILIGGSVCDASGKVTHPEDVGATAFYDLAIEGGYIIATVITGSYNGTIKKLGVMNTDFQWLVEPTEELYNAFGEAVEWQQTTISFCNNGIYYNCAEGRKNDLFLDFETGELIGGDKISFGIETWAFEDAGKIYYYEIEFQNPAGEVVLDLSEHKSTIGATNFADNRAVVSFINNDTNKYYYTLIDETGEFQFEPKEIEGLVKLYDGQYYIATNGVFVEFAVSYDSEMNVLGRLDKPENIGQMNVKMYDGVITVFMWYSQSDEVEYCHYKMDFTPLFEMEQEK